MIHCDWNILYILSEKEREYPKNVETAKTSPTINNETIL